MRLTKDEKLALAKDIAQDIPENYHVYSPWTWVWLLYTLALLVGLSIMGATLFEKYSWPFSVAPVLAVLVAGVMLVNNFLLLCSGQLKPDTNLS